MKLLISLAVGVLLIIGIGCSESKVIERLPVINTGNFSVLFSKPVSCNAKLTNCQRRFLEFYTDGMNADLGD